MELKNLDLNNFSLEEEVRNEYRVSPKMKRIWAVQIDLVMELLRVCEKYDIKVYAFAGTLLGAVRHKGFIPWDDDLDVCLLREDFEKLLEVADKEFDSPYFFQTAWNDRKYFCGYARLRNSTTTGVILNKSSSEYNNGIYIDVFVMDGFVENKIKLKFQLLQKYIICLMLDCYYKDYVEESGFRFELRSFAQKCLHKFIKYDTLIKQYNKILTKYNKKSNKVTLLTHNSYFRNRYWCEKDDLKEVEYLDYECIKLPAPKNYDNMLKHMYGDYMKFPPVEKRGLWHDNQIVIDPDVQYKVYIEEHLNVTPNK